MALSDGRMLVFARPAGVQQTETLEARVGQFLMTGPDPESIDDLTFQKSGFGKIADYFIANRLIVAELKTINSASTTRIEQIVRVAMDQEPRLFAVGRVGISAMLRNRPNWEETSRQMVQVGGQAVRQALQRANSQIARTREQFDAPNALGLAVLMFEQGQKTDASCVAFAVREALTGASPLTNIDYVWATMENHRIRTPSGGLGYPEMLIWRKASEAQPVRKLLGQMLDAWADKHGVDLEHVDHTVSWSTLNPIGPGWPASINIYP